MTNAERIRNLTDKELAETYIYSDSFFSNFESGICYRSIHGGMSCRREEVIKEELEWLKSEV